MNTAPNSKPPSARNRFTGRIGQVLVVGGLLTLLVAGPLQPRVAAMRSGEGVYIPDAHYQFTPQQVSSGAKTLSHTFTLYNGRTQPLKVEASADCGCTGLSWQSATLPPFGRKQITASMKPSSGPSSVHITFKTASKNYVFAQIEAGKQ